jgi:hypothetical protein
MFGFIRSISLTAQIMVPVYGLVFFATAWFLPGAMKPAEVIGNGLYYQPADGWLYGLWAGMARLPFWMQVLPAYLTALVSAILLVRNDLDNLLMGRRSFAIAFVFFTLLGSQGHFFVFHPAFIAGIFLILSQRFLLYLYKSEADFSLVFLAGFCWSVAILLYPPVLVLIPALIFGVLLMISTTWRHWTVLFLGLALPFLIISSIFALTGQLSYQVDSFSSWFGIRTQLLPDFLVREPFLAAWFGLLLFWIVLASVRYRNPRIQSRQFLFSGFIFFLILTGATLVLKSVSVEVLWLLILPVSYLMSYWLLEARKGWVRDLFFLSILASFVFFRIRALF